MNFHEFSIRKMKFGTIDYFEIKTRQFLEKFIDYPDPNSEFVCQEFS